MQHEASYDPADNKIRIRPECRLDADEYAKVKAAGYKWAPRQELFVAPMWTPQREDVALELCGEIGDEDTSLVDRAEERAERFTRGTARTASATPRAHKLPSRRSPTVSRWVNRSLLAITAKSTPVRMPSESRAA